MIRPPQDSGLVPAPSPLLTPVAAARRSHATVATRSGSAPIIRPPSDRCRRSRHGRRRNPRGAQTPALQRRWAGLDATTAAAACEASSAHSSWRARQRHGSTTSSTSTTAGGGVQLRRPKVVAAKARANRRRVDIAPRRWCCGRTAAPATAPTKAAATPSAAHSAAQRTAHPAAPPRPTPRTIPTKLTLYSRPPKVVAAKSMANGRVVDVPARRDTTARGG